VRKWEGEIYIEVDAVPSHISLDSTCWACKGSGCEDCESTGYRLTETGCAILQLIKRHTITVSRTEVVE
jgi:hypothetical protein